MYDVRLLVNNKHKQVGHANMFLMDVTSPATQVMKPAPLVVFTPALLAIAGQSNCSTLDCNLVETSQTVYLELKDADNVFVKSKNLLAVSRELDLLMAYNWRPDFPASLQSQSARLGRITIDAVKDLWQGGTMNKDDMPKLIAKL